MPTHYFIFYNGICDINFDGSIVTYSDTYSSALLDTVPRLRRETVSKVWTFWVKKYMTAWLLNPRLYAPRVDVCNTRPPHLISHSQFYIDVLEGIRVVRLRRDNVSRHTLINQKWDIRESLQSCQPGTKTFKWQKSININIDKTVFMPILINQTDLKYNNISITTAASITKFVIRKTVK